MRRAAPRSLATAIATIREAAAPETPLAAVQAVWADLAGPAVAAAAQPVEEREGVLTVRCESAVWAQELDLMQATIIERLRERLGDRAPSRLRCISASNR